MLPKSQKRIFSKDKKMEQKIKLSSEQQLYPDLIEWTKNFLSAKHPGFQIVVKNTSQTTVKAFLQSTNLIHYFPEAETYEIAVDITGVAWKNKKSKIPEIYLMIMEVKRKKIDLRSLSQLLGYARIVRPFYAFIVSPNKWSEGIQRLVICYNRTDILEYESLYLGGNNKKYKKYVIVANWDPQTKNIRPGDTLVPSYFPK